MVWFLLGLLFVAGNSLVLIGRLWGTDGIFLAMMLGLAALAVLLYGSLASIAFTLKLPLVGWLLTTLLVGQLIHIGWQIYQALR